MRFCSQLRWRKATSSANNWSKCFKRCWTVALGIIICKCVVLFLNQLRKKKRETFEFVKCRSSCFWQKQTNAYWKSNKANTSGWNDSISRLQRKSRKASVRRNDQQFHTIRTNEKLSVFTSEKKSFLVIFEKEKHGKKEPFDRRVVFLFLVSFKCLLFLWDIFVGYSRD